MPSEVKLFSMNILKCHNFIQGTRLQHLLYVYINAHKWEVARNWKWVKKYSITILFSKNGVNFNQALAFKQEK